MHFCYKVRNIFFFRAGTWNRNFFMYMSRKVLATAAVLSVLAVAVEISHTTQYSILIILHERRNILRKWLNVLRGKSDNQLKKDYCNINAKYECVLSIAVKPGNSRFEFIELKHHFVVYIFHRPNQCTAFKASWQPRALALPVRVTWLTLSTIILSTFDNNHWRCRIDKNYISLFI